MSKALSGLSQKTIDSNFTLTQLQLLQNQIDGQETEIENDNGALVYDAPNQNLQVGTENIPYEPPTDRFNITVGSANKVKGTDNVVIGNENFVFSTVGGQPYNNIIINMDMPQSVMAGKHDVIFLGTQQQLLPIANNSIILGNCTPSNTNKFQLGGCTAVIAGGAFVTCDHYIRIRYNNANYCIPVINDPFGDV
jgi:hypothetical protein